MIESHKSSRGETSGGIGGAAAPMIRYQLSII